MVTTDDSGLADRLRASRSHGIERPADRVEAEPWYYEMVDLGYNYRIADFACALGLSQMRTIDARLRRREQIVDRYYEAFADFEALRLPRQKEGDQSAWHLFAVRVVPDRLTVDRAEVFRALRAENIGVQVHYIPVHFHP